MGKRSVEGIIPVWSKEYSKIFSTLFLYPITGRYWRTKKAFYPNEGKKIVPPNIKELLSSPLALAIWYQDDGTLDFRDKYHRNAMFATHCFSFEDCTLLKDTLQENFGIKSSVCKCRMRGKMYYRLYVFSASMEIFVEAIRPYIHNDYAYKIR